MLQLLAVAVVHRESSDAADFCYGSRSRPYDLATDSYKPTTDTAANHSVETLAANDTLADCSKAAASEIIRLLAMMCWAGALCQSAGVDFQKNIRFANDLLHQAS